MSGDPSFDFDDIDISGSSSNLSDIERTVPDLSTSAQSVRSADSMDTSNPNPVASNVAANSPGQSVGAGGSPAVGSMGPLQFPLSTSNHSGRATFTKQHVMFSYAFANKSSSPTATKTTSTAYCTSLSFIPVDFLPFYLSPSEFQNLPQGARIENVTCTVKLLGVRSAFNTGTTDAQVAISEYCPILLTAVGLNHKLSLRNVSYTSAGMVPSACSNFSPKDCISKWYTDEICSVNCIPRSNSITPL